MLKIKLNTEFLFIFFKYSEQLFKGINGTGYAKIDFNLYH